MPARRCTTCSINWPNRVPEFKECPRCEADTWYSANSEALTDDEVKAARMDVNAELAPPSATHLHRVERYQSLGFSEVDAQLLACAQRLENDSTGRLWTHPLNWLDVKAILGQGCTHAEAVAIYA